jgi:hypothetical protein
VRGITKRRGEALGRESYRKREAEQAQKAKQTKPSPKPKA